MAVLRDYLTDRARRSPGRVAIEDPGVAEITYGELDRLSDRVRDRLRALGVRPGDRVGLALRKSIDSLAAIFGIQKCGAAHVPVDASGPVDRAITIFENCAVAA